MHAYKSDERELRQQRAHSIGPSDARHLRLVADDIEDEGILELPGVDAERLRLLAQKLDADADEVDSLREHANNLHRALCEAYEELDDSGDDGDMLTFVFIAASAPFAPAGALTPEEASKLASFLLDETE